MNDGAFQESIRAERRKKVLAQKLLQISRRKLAKLLDVKESTIRDSVNIPSQAGVRKTPTTYQKADVVEYLKSLNQGKDVSSEQFLSTAKAAELLSNRLNCSLSTNKLANSRRTRGGPLSVHVTRRTVRYRVEDLECWIDQLKENR